MTARPTEPHDSEEHPMLRTAPARQAAIFLGLVYLIVTGIALALPEAEVAAPMLTMVTPVFVVVLLTLFATPRGHRVQLWRTFGLRHLGLRGWPAAIVLPVLFVLIIPWGIATMLGFVSFAGFEPSALGWLVDIFIMGVVITTFLALGEEIGWRGYLLPRMQQLLPKRHAALAVGFVHGLFHLPLMLLTTTYNAVGNRALVSVTMVTTLTAAGVLYAWLQDRTGSVWPVAIAHSAVNTVIDGAFLFAIVSPVALAYTAGESGIVTLLAMVAVAAVLLMRGSTWGDATTDIEAATVPTAPAS
jgi:membrane protease YdiL (CAAX protease family)